MGRFVVVVCNFTPVPRVNYTLGVPEAGAYNELLNSDAGSYGGSNRGNLGRVQRSAPSVTRTALQHHPDTPTPLDPPTSS